MDIYVYHSSFSRLGILIAEFLLMEWYQLDLEARLLPRLTGEWKLLNCKYTLKIKIKHTHTHTFNKQPLVWREKSKQVRVSNWV